MAIRMSRPESTPSEVPPSLEAGAEMRAVRAQAAVVRSLLDELEHLAPASGSQRLGDAIAAQTVEELTSLAHRMLAAAEHLSPRSEPPPTGRAEAPLYASPEYRVVSDPELRHGHR